MSASHGSGMYRGLGLVTKQGTQLERAFLGMGMTTPQTGSVPAGRFGRIFHGLPTYEPSNKALELLAEEMRETNQDASGDSTIPLAIVFLGQFIDHDITFDPVSRLDERLDPDAIKNFRTPVLDLDNVYGEGPDASRHLYDTVGKNPASEHRLPFRLLIDPAQGNFDLARNSQGTALIGDPRNDENLLLSQLQRAFVGFHNAVVTKIEGDAAGNPPANKDLFEQARKTVTLHYLHIVLTEFLPHIAGQAMVDDVLINGRKFFNWEQQADRPFIPVEFSGAAYRFGHSLIRESYNLNDNRQGIKLFDLPFFGTCPLGDCGVNGPSADYNLDWNYFIQFSDPTKVQFCRKVDEKIAPPLFDLPFIHQAQDAPKSLPERNMRRARTLKLPAGQDIAAAMGESVLSNTDLGIDAIDGLGGKAPLWFYILKESGIEASGQHLGPVGGRIITETLIAMMEVVFSSYEPNGSMATWTPCLPNRNGDVGSFGLADLIHHATS